MRFIRNLIQFIRLLNEVLTNLREINMKLTELGGSVKELKGQVAKVFNEQQGTIDAAKAKITELESALANQDNVPDDVTAALNDLKALVQTADDQTPDTEGIEPA